MEALAILFAGVGLALLVTALLGTSIELAGVKPPAPTTRFARAVTGGVGAILVGASLAMSGVLPPPDPAPSPSPSAETSGSATPGSSGGTPVPSPSDGSAPPGTGSPTPVLATPTLPPIASGPWRGMPAAFNGGIDAAVTRDIGFMYLFDDDVYIRFDDLVGGAGGGATSTAGNWHGMPTDFQAGIDAATQRLDGYIYFFKNDRYIRFPPDLTQDATAPVLTAANWHGLPASFHSKIDAAMTDEGGRIYFFRGNQFVRFTAIAAGVDAGYPRTISSYWTGLPQPFEAGIHAALMAPDGSTFFFKDDEYVRFSPGRTQVDVGHPQKIGS